MLPYSLSLFFVFLESFTVIYRFILMKKKEVKPQPVVTHLKVSPYLKSWMECKYGKVIAFQPMTLQHSCLCRYLVNNASMKKLTAFCYNDAFFNYQNKDSFFVSGLSEEEKVLFIAIELPETIWKGFNEQTTNRYWQLSKTGAKEMRKIIKNEFRMELFKFISDCSTRAIINGTKTGIEQAVDDFITMYDIDMKERENLLRDNRRSRPQTLQSIEEDRESTEKKYDRQFCYT